MGEKETQGAAEVERSGPVRLDPTPARVAGRGGGGAWQGENSLRMKADLDTAAGTLATGAARGADDDAGDTGKVVEKATSGVKSTMQTQV